jgi:hypothetical protein
VTATAPPPNAEESTGRFEDTLSRQTPSWGDDSREACEERAVTLSKSIAAILGALDEKFIVRDPTLNRAVQTAGDLLRNDYGPDAVNAFYHCRALARVGLVLADGYRLQQKVWYVKDSEL